MQYRNFGKFLRNKRLSSTHKITLNSFSVETSIDSATISRIECQKQGITLEQLSKIASFYNVSVSKLIEEFELNR